MKFGDNLRVLRAQKKISQKEIGELIGVTSQAISRWENNETQPDNEALLKLAKYFNVTTDYLLGATNENLKNDKSNFDNELDEALFSKAKDLTEEEKKAVLSVINAIKKEFDEENK